MVSIQPTPPLGYNPEALGDVHFFKKCDVFQFLMIQYFYDVLKNTKFQDIFYTRVNHSQASLKTSHFLLNDAIF